MAKPRRGSREGRGRERAEEEGKLGKAAVRKDGRKEGRKERLGLYVVRT